MAEVQVQRQDYTWLMGKIRKLSPRECARVQGFPDDFILNSSDSPILQTIW